MRTPAISDLVATVPPATIEFVCEQIAAMGEEARKSNWAECFKHGGNVVAIWNGGTQLWLKNGDCHSTQIFGCNKAARERYDAIVCAFSELGAGGQK